jgi:hypothetical protein
VSIYATAQPIYSFVLDVDFDSFCVVISFHLVGYQFISNALSVSAHVFVYSLCFFFVSLAQPMKRH